MRPDARAYLWDIQQAIEAINRFLNGVTADDYGGSEIVRAAVERKFEIIGEALNQIAKFDPGMVAQIPHFRAIISFRNLLIHGYAAVDDQRVLAIARSSLPELSIAVGALLDERL